MQWRKSTYSSDTANCVEVAGLPDLIALRDSKQRGGPQLLCETAAWRALVWAIKAGGFDRI